MSGLNVAVGVAGEKQMGWLHLLQSELDVTKEEDWNRHFQPGSINNILAEHVWEHLTWTQAHKATRLCFRFLKPGGRLRLAVPDAMHASTFIVDAVSATGSLAHEHGHLVDYNYKLIGRLLSEEGFEIQFQDWWDENKNFYSNYSGNDDHGYVIRSYANWPKHPSTYREPKVYQRLVDSYPLDKRDGFIARGISHTSLIVDGIKPL